MKRHYKKLLSVLGAVCLIAPFAGCEVDAEEANTNATANASAEAVAGAPGGDDPIQPSDADAGTPGEATNGVVNQQTTIIQRIPPTLPPEVNLTSGVEEVVKLLQSGVSETVVLLFVEKSTESFELDAADIVYLNDIGVPPTVMAAMLNHDGADPDILHDALPTNSVASVTIPPAQATAPGIEVSSNYVAAPQYGGTVLAQDPNAPVAQPAYVEQQPVVVQQQPTVVVTQPAVTYSYFYDSLSPYGSWVYVADYGWCWQPTIAVTHRSWRPYMHGGRWLHSDVGWYWHSDYSWGWAPFHYGRWHSAPRVGWVWTPDYTWGPSWVTWRRNRDYCGWAPLPPRTRVRPGVGFSYWGRDVGFNFSFGYSHDYYTFVPTRRFCDRRVIDHVVPTDRSVNIYKDSTVVNNYIVGNNNTIINNGVGRDYVASHTRNEIPRVRVAETSRSNGRIAPDRLVRQGAETVVYRPQRPAPSLVAAHEAAVARTRTEIARPGGAASSDGPATRRNSIASRPNSSGTVASAPTTSRANSELRATSPRGGSSPVTRRETARPQITRGNSEVPAPAFAKPAPIRPEPDRSAEILRSRAAQETHSRPSTVGGGLTSTRPAARPDVVRPNGGGSVIRPGSTRALPQPSTRPGAPAVSTRPGSSVRSETGRGTAAPSVTRPAPAAPARPVQRGGGTTPSRTETSRPTTALPSGSSGLVNSAAASPTFSRPAVAAQSTSRTASQTVRRSHSVAQSPAFAQPVPNAARPATTINRNLGSAIQPGVAGPAASSPAWSRPSSTRGNVATSPQTIQRSAPTVQAPAAARPSVIQRSEGFSRSAAPVRPAPQRTIVQPRSVSPVAPAQRPAATVMPQASRPAASAPVVRSAPPVRSAPRASQPHVRGGSVRSAPAARPASRPSSSSSSGGRGRVEIGR